MANVFPGPKETKIGGQQHIHSTALRSLLWSKLLYHAAGGLLLISSLETPTDLLLACQ